MVHALEWALPGVLRFCLRWAEAVGPEPYGHCQELDVATHTFRPIENFMGSNWHRPPSFGYDQFAGSATADAQGVQVCPPGGGPCAAIAPRPDAANERLRRTPARALEFTIAADGSVVALYRAHGPASGPTEGHAEVYDVHSGRLLSEVRPHVRAPGAWVDALALVDATLGMATQCDPQQACHGYLVDLRTGRELLPVPGRPAGAVLRVLTGGQLAIVDGGLGGFAVFDRSPLRLARQVAIDVHRPTDMYAGWAIGGDGTLVASVYNGAGGAQREGGTVVLMDLARGSDGLVTLRPPDCAHVASGP